MALTFPTVNLNGTSGAALLDQQLTALNALMAAREALWDAAPNGRDYTPQGTAEGLARLAKAQEEHARRVRLIDQILIEIETIAEHIA